MKNFLPAFLLTIMFATDVAAQSKDCNWQITPSFGYAQFNNGEAVRDVGFMFGRYVGLQRNVRIDLRGDYLYSTRGKDRMSTSVLATIETPFSGAERFFSISSYGLGALFPVSSGSESERRFFDVIIPVRFGAGWRMNEHLSIGAEALINFNLNSFKTRTLYSTGLFLGMRF
jgi:hypothetical protein